VSEKVPPKAVNLLLTIHESGPAGPKHRATLWRTTCNLKCLFISAYGRFMFAFWQTGGYFNIFSNKVNKKTAKKAIF
jgi:hypothetical protein